MESITYKNIIAEGDVTKEMFYKFFEMTKLSQYDNLDKIQVKASNGLSGVFIYENEAYQVFVSESIATRIYSLFNDIRYDIIHEIDLGFDDMVKIKYDLSEFLPQIRAVNPPCIIWERITPLNSFDKSKITEIIEINIFKILWDIGRALIGLHKNKINHGDARIDNIGIKGNNFVLYDFDSSKISQTFRGDFLMFTQSIKYNMDKKYKNIEKYIPEKDSYNFLESLVEQKDLSFFEELKIII